MPAVLPFRETMLAVERRLLVDALAQVPNRRQCAKALGISLRMLYYKLRIHGLSGG